MKESLVWPNPLACPPEHFLEYWQGGKVTHPGGAGELPADERAVADVISQWTSNPDENDCEWDTAAVVRLVDGRYVAWGSVQGPIHLANDLERIVRYGLTNEGRERLGLSIPDQEIDPPRPGWYPLSVRYSKDPEARRIWDEAHTRAEYQAIMRKRVEEGKALPS